MPATPPAVRRLLPSILPFGLLCFALSCATSKDDTSSQYRQWTAHGGDKTGSHYSSLDQITRENVAQLEVAWVYHAGDAGARSQIQCNPIIIDSVLYATTPGLKAFALDAATGRELWKFDPFAGKGLASALGVNRGVTYWADGDDRRILFTAGESLYALDARTGQPIPTFGQGGSVSLKEGLAPGRDLTGLFISANTPGALYRDLLILGSRVSEELPSAPGHIRAFDVRTGAVRWTFHTIPQPGEFGYETWPAGAHAWAGGANAWSGVTVDEGRGLVFLPTGSAAFDFWGGNRHGENLFANAVLALNAETGARVWHFQIVRHDLWDRDPPAAPNLVTVAHEGRRVDAVAQVTKSGHVWLLDRETGQPLFPVEERQVPGSDLRGEAAWPTQVLPTKPPAFARQQLTEADLTDLTPQAHAAVLQRFRQVRSGGQWVPPSKEGTVIFPGFDGGAEWGGAAVDPRTGIMYVNANEMPWILQMMDLDEAASQKTFTLGPRVFAANCTNCHGFAREGAPAHNVPALLDLDAKYNKEQVRQIIGTGRGVMPSFAHLGKGEVDALLAFLFDEEPPETTMAKFDFQVPYNHMGYNRFLDPQGYPAVKPPWGTLNAIDLNRGEILWQVPLGELPELTAKGIPPTGTENYGGPVLTASGLLFIGATKDERFRAFDTETGKVLWETKLPAGGYATPATYEVNGRQYVVIAAGGGKMGTKSGDAYVAFALP
jgi:quinoprotein glucose dehydrogenase